MTAEWFIFVLFSKKNEFFALRKTVRVICRATASYADCVDFLNVFSNCHECRHRSKRLAEEVCVKAGDDNSDSSVGKSLNNFYDALIKELSLVNTYNLNVV